MLAPGGRVAIHADCAGCGVGVVVAEAVTPPGALAGAHVRQIVYNVPTLTVRGGKLYCHECDERERQQLDLRHG